MNSCNCDIGPGNSGTPSCLEIARVAKKIIFVPTYKADGTRNGIVLATPIDQAFLTARVNDEPAERWYPYQIMKNLTDERAENEYETASDGSKAFIQEGLRTVSFQFWDNPDPVLLGKLKSYMCVDMSYYTVDKNGNIIGTISSDGLTLYPKMIDKNSFAPTLINASDTTVQKIAVTFDLSRLEYDEDTRMIAASEYTGDIMGLRGLLDVESVITNEAVATFTAKLQTQYGTASNKGKVTGLLPGDFVLYNVTDGAPVVILTAPEAPDGTYTFTFAAQTSGDILRLTPTKNGYDFTAVIANLIEIP